MACDPQTNCPLAREIRSRLSALERRGESHDTRLRAVEEGQASIRTELRSISVSLAAVAASLSTGPGDGMTGRLRSVETQLDDLRYRKRREQAQFAAILTGLSLLLLDLMMRRIFS